MNRITVVCLLVFSVLISGVAEAADTSKSMAITFPNFSISPGEKILSVSLRISHGRLGGSFRPRRWMCEYDEEYVHCYAPHSSYALPATSMIPEIYVKDIPENRGRPNIEASLMIVDQEGREFKKVFRDDEMLVR